MQIRLMTLLLTLMVFTGCSKVDYDPTTTILKWVINNQKEEKNEKEKQNKDR